MLAAADFVIALCSSMSPLSSLILHWPSEKLIEGLKSPDTSSLMLPDLLSLSDPFGGSVEESAKGARVFQNLLHLIFFLVADAFRVVVRSLTFLELGEKTAFVCSVNSH